MGRWRRFHGQVKEALLVQHAGGRRVLDVGSGVGGDVWRWLRAGVRSVVGLEPDEESVAEFGRRVEHAGRSDRFFAVHQTGLASERVFAFGEGAFECVTLMFVAHLLGDDLPSLLSAALRVLRPGSPVVVCIPDGDMFGESGPEVVSVSGEGEAVWGECVTGEAPYFQRECACAREPVLGGGDLACAMRAAGFVRVSVTPFSCFEGFAEMSEEDKAVSRVFSCAVGFKV